MFVLKADDATKLLEPPRLTQLLIRPLQPVLRPKEQVAFSCSAVDQYGDSFPVPAVEWSATGGTITVAGLYTAGTTGGLHTVKASAGGNEGSAEIHIRTQADRDGEGEGDKVQIPGMRVLSWRGVVPWQKWTNFYKNVLTRLVRSPDLKLEVSIEVPLENDKVQTLAAETRAGLKELGLDAEVEVT